MDTMTSRMAGLHSDEMLRMAISAGNGRSGLTDWARALGQVGSVEFVLVREKHLPAGELVNACREVRAALSPATQVLVSGRVDIALAAGLDGVHLSAAAGELRVAQVRALFRKAWVSVSCHTLDDVRQARDDHASAILFAPVFGKTVDGMAGVRGTGLEALRAACREAGETPVFALGGVTLQNAEACVAVGAAGVAGIRLFQEKLAI